MTPIAVGQPLVTLINVFTVGWLPRRRAGGPGRYSCLEFWVALIALAGFGWLIFLSPPIANSLLIYLGVLGFVAEAALMLWLLVRGVNVRRWQQIARGSSQDA